MHIRWIKTNLSTIQRICLSGLFVALITVLQKVVAINYLAFAPFVRISLGGPALIMFASILLGPIYGLFIGMGSDVLGYFIFDIKAYPFFPQVTAIYSVLGFVSYFVFSFVFSIRNRKALTIIEICFMLAVWLTLTLYILLNNQINLMGRVYELNTLIKTLVPVVSGVIFLSITLFSVFYKPKDEETKSSSLHICFASFICDFFVLVIFGSLMKACAFGFATFIAIITCQLLVMFFNVLLDTFFITAFQRFTKKYFVED